MPPKGSLARQGSASHAISLLASVDASTDISDALILLATTCEASGHPLQAIHCLATLLANSKLARSQEARARCMMGRLMLEHTINSKAAHKELLAAQALVKDILGTVSLKCEIACQLARYFQSQGEVAYQVQLHDQALALCSEGTASSEGPILHRWMLTLYLLKAQAYASDGDVTRAVQAVQAGHAYGLQHMAQHAPLLMDVLVLMQLFLMQLYLTSGNEEGYMAAEALALHLLSQAPVVIMATASIPSPAPTPALGSMAYSIPPGFIPAARLHLQLLQALHLLSLGRVDELLTWGDPSQTRGPTHGVSPPPPQGQPGQVLQAMARQAQQGEPSGYMWLSPPMISSLISLISAVLALGRGKLKTAVEEADIGLIALAPALVDMRLDHATVNEASLSEDAISLLECRPPLAMQTQLILAKASARLELRQMQAAQTDILTAMNLVGRFPNQLQLMMFPVHVIAAQYAYACGEHTAAARHLQAVKQHSMPGQRAHLLASALLAMTLLAQGGGVDSQKAVQAAIDALGTSQYANPQVDQADTSHHGPEGVVCLIAKSLIKLQLGMTQEGRHLLSCALEEAHKRLNNYTLVAQVMAFMMPLQAKTGDVSGPIKMAQSGILLSKQNPAIQAQVHHALSVLWAEQGAPDKSAEAAAVASAKSEEVASLVQAATHTPEHAELLGWGLRQA